MRHKHGLQLMIHYLTVKLDVGIKYKESTSDDINNLIGYSDSGWGQDKGSRRHHGIPLAYQ